jgi:hypothetical protein
MAAQVCMLVSTLANPAAFSAVRLDLVDRGEKPGTVRWNDLGYVAVER